MDERMWTFTVTRTVTSEVHMTEAEIVAYLRDHNLDLPDLSDFEPTAWEYHLGNWTNQVAEAIQGDQVAIGDLFARRSGVTVIEEGDTFEDLEIDQDTSDEEDEAWRPAGWQDTVTEGEDEEPDPLILADTEPWTKVATLVPDREPASEWWQ